MLAHELGHHLGLHTVALTITHWLSLPIITLARIGFLLERLAFAASDLLARRSAGLALIGRIVSAILQVIALAFLATVLIARRIGDRLGRSSEFTADERAVDMGYGRHLVMALRRVHAMDRQEAAAERAARAIGGHPSPVLRTARIEARLRAEPGLTRRPADARSGRQQLPHPSGRPPDDRHVALDDDRPLHERLAGDEQVDDRPGLGVVRRVEPQLLELRVLPDEIGDGILQDGDDALEGLPVRRVFMYSTTSNSTPSSRAAARAFLDEFQCGLW